MLIVVEDLHWADQSTRDLMSFLFGRGFDAPVALVGSYRSDDLHRRHPLRRQVAVWARMAGVERVQVEPLDSADVRRLVAQLHPDPLPEERVRDIVARAEGNAFFVEELVGTTWARDGRIPEDLVDVLLVRLETLDDSAVSVVRAAAVAGRRVSHPALSAVVDLPPAELDAAVRDAVEGHVLVPSADDFYQFRHALLAEAVYDDLLPGERTSLHAAYSRALLDGRAAGTAAELARHARLAKDYATALTASLRAGDDARAVGGAEEAAQHYLQALDLWHDTRLPDDLDLDHPRLVGLVCDALIAAGHPARALGVAREQLAHLPAAAEGLVRGQLLGVVAGALVLTETQEDPLALTTEAVALVPDQPTNARSKVLAVHARMLARFGHYDEAREVAMTALALAERLDMPRLASDIRTTLVGLQRGGSSEALVEALRSAIEQAQKADAATAELRALHLLGNHHLDRGEFREADAAFERTTVRARAEGTPWVPYAAEARWLHGVSLKLQGRWDESLEVLDITGEVVPPIYAAMFTATRLEILAARGDGGAASLARALHPFWRQEGLVAVTGGSAELTLHELAGDPVAALATYRHIVDTLTGIWHPLFQARVRLATVTLAAFATCGHAPQCRRAGRRRGRRRGALPRRPEGPRPSGRLPGLLGSREPGLGGSARGRAPALALGRRRRPAVRRRAAGCVARGGRALRDLRRPLRAGPGPGDPRRHPGRHRRPRRRPGADRGGAGGGDGSRRPAAGPPPGCRGRRRADAHPGHADPARGRDPGAGRRGPEQRRDRTPALHQHQDRLGARLQHPGQARRQRPHRGGGHRPPGGPARLTPWRGLRVLVVWRQERSRP